MRIHIAADNLMEVVGAGLLIAGIAIVVGLGAALLAAAFAAIMLAEFSWAGKTWSIRLGKVRVAKEAREQRKVKRQLLHWKRNRVAEKEAVAARYPLTTERQLDPDKYTEIRVTR